MNLFPLEIVDHILYFTKNKVIDLCQVCKYFNVTSNIEIEITLESQLDI